MKNAKVMPTVEEEALDFRLPPLRGHHLMKFVQFKSGGSDVYVNPVNVVYIEEHGKDKTVLFLTAGQPVTVDENVETVRHTLE
jgi:hypothetical protein